MAGRRTSLASLAGQKVEDVPGQSDPLLLALPLDKVVPTRFNPRRRFGTDEELREFGQKLAKKQLQPAVVVSRTAYLKLWPEEAEHVGSTPYVIANGERRYRASLLVGRPTLDVVHNEDVANSRAEFLDAVQSENNDRENLDPIERALGIDIMVTQLGGSGQVAAYYGKTKGWVSQQRKLLKLTDDLQDLVSVGEMPVRVARDIASLPAEVQVKAWEEELERRRQEKETAAQLRAQAANHPQPGPPPRPNLEPAPKAKLFTAVNSPPSPPEPEPEDAQDQPEPFTAVNGQASPQVNPPQQRQAEARPSQIVPEPRTDNGAPPTLRYDDGAFLGMHLPLKMENGPYFLMLRVLLEKGEEKDPQKLREVLDQWAADTE